MWCLVGSILVAFLALGCQAESEAELPVRKNPGTLNWGPLECESDDFKHERYDGQDFSVAAVKEAGTVKIEANEDKHELTIILNDELPIQNYMGNWSCKANNWVVIGPPYIYRIGKAMDEDRHRASLAVMEEEKLANGLICEAYYFGLKRPEFLWVVYEEDTEIEINITGRWVIEEQEPEGSMYTSKLKLVDENGIRMSDRANYTCTVTAEGEDGKDKRGILLRVKGKLAALWPFLGICAEVLILCTGIFIYERKTKANNADADADATNEGDVVVAVDAKPDDVRKRAPVKT